ncbi:interleukin-17 receptor A [Microcaecilia unicolor]|uniref:Interleukin-17 receptor A n=1 Tax=Microcaecilia unicolor TaxID=1415580 RepID=A0A6P7Z2J4_9AMPH|nr:interleukin-17 receptor A [Microcaecilia unicolor]
MFLYSGSTMLWAVAPSVVLSGFLFVLGFLCSGIPALRVLHSPPFNCSQKGLTCEVKNSSCLDDSWIRPYTFTPSAPSSLKVDINFTRDEEGHLVPVLVVEWTVGTDASVLVQQGAELSVLQVSSNIQICVQFDFVNNLNSQHNPDGGPWSFMFDRFVVEPGKTYDVTVHHLPKLGTTHDPNQKSMLCAVPDCRNQTMKQMKSCMLQGSHWEPNITAEVREKNMMIGFNAENSSSAFRIYVTSFKFNRTCRQYYQEVEKPWSFPRTNVMIPLEDNREACCFYEIQIQAFFETCENDCIRHLVSLPCPTLSTTEPSPVFTQPLHWYIPVACVLLVIFATGIIFKLVCHKPPETSKITPTSPPDPSLTIQRVWIVYSADHPLYVKVVLKFAELLQATCGTEVTLDLLQESEIAKVGVAAWVNRQKQEMEEKSSKIIILCSHGTRAKWQAMMGEDKARVCLKQDCRHPAGDLCTPAFNLIMPDFGKPANFGKYIIAYFNAVSSENDIPEPFKVTTNYQLMKEFEQVFFRIHNIEQHHPGWVYSVENIKYYTRNSSGQSLEEALCRFQNWQKVYSDWFEKECLLSKDLVEEEEEPLDSLIELQQYKGGIQKQQPVFQKPNVNKCFKVDLSCQENEEKVGKVEPLLHPVGHHGNSSLQTVISNGQDSTVQVLTPLPHLLGKNMVQRLQPYEDSMEETPLLSNMPSVRNELISGDVEYPSLLSDTDNTCTSVPLTDELSDDVKRQLERLMFHQLYQSIMPSELSPIQNDENQLNAQCKAFEDQRQSVQSDQGYSSRMSPVSTEGPMEGEGENEASDEQISPETLESLKSIQRRCLMQTFDLSSFYEEEY